MYDIQNFPQRTISLLASQFQGTLPNGNFTNFQKFLTAIVSEAQIINDVQLQLANDRYLATAQGVQLDGIGKILGLNRIPGESDSDYREKLYFQVFINKSTGTPEEAIATLKFLTKAQKIGYFEPYPAFYQMSTDGLFSNFSIPPDEIVVAIQAISPAGVQYVPITVSNGNTPIFVFSSDPIVEDFYVAPNADDLNEIVPFHVDPDGISDDQFQINRGQTQNNPLGGGFAEDNYVVNGAGKLSEVLVLNGNIPPNP